MHDAQNNCSEPRRGRLKVFRLENIFCDRDGTIIHDRNYLSDPAGVELLSGAASGLVRLLAGGTRLFVVTNQSGIGRGLFGAKEYLACHKRLEELLAGQGITLAGSAHCPHAPVGDGAREGCACRKPAVGMWKTLAAAHNLNPKGSVMIGDKTEDVLFGKNAGFARTILVLTGEGEKSAATLGLPELPAGSSFVRLPAAGPAGVGAPAGWPDCLARNLDGAADFLLAEKNT